MEIEHAVTVKILFFAKSKELAGTRESTIRLPAKINYKRLVNILAENYNLETIKHNILIAKNEQVCEEEFDIEISDTDNIAVIPPISGEEARMDHLKLTVDKLSVEEVSDLVTDDTCGAVSLFIGTTRDNFEDKKVLQLEYEAYESMALKALKSICEEIRQKWSAVHSIAIHHRLGVVPCREASVIIAISSPHRRDSLDSVAHCIDQLKANVPIWKKEVYEAAEPVWKENVECTRTKPDVKPQVRPPIDKNLVQINVTSEELQQRIQNFIERKRAQVNISNIHDFIPGKMDSDVDTETCARVRTQFVRRNDSKGHLKVRKVHNEWGPQTVTAADFYPEADKQVDTSGLPVSIAERVVAIEKYLNIGPVPRDIYKRLKDMEDKIAYLQAVSPEYAQFWKTKRERKDSKEDKLVDYTFSADDIAKRIEELEKGVV